MADQRQPFRFRLPWLPPTATPTPPPAPAPRPRQPAAAPPRPAFRPPGLGPTPPPPRVGPPLPPPTPTPPNTTDQGSAPKPTSPPKTEPPSNPLEPAPPKAIEQGSGSKPSSSAKTEPPSNPITPTGPQTTLQQPTPPKSEPLPKPTSPSKTKPPSKPIAPTGPQVTLTQPAPKTKTPPPKQPAMPPSPKAPSPSPSRSPARLKHSSPSSSSPPTPRDKALKKPHNSPKKESPSPTPKHPTSPTLCNESSPSKKQPHIDSSQTASNSDEVVAPNPIKTSPIDQNGRPMTKEVSEVPESGTVLEPVSSHKKEMITTSGVGKREAQTSYTSSNSYTKPGKSNHNHKPAPLQKEIKEDISKFVHKLGRGHGKQTLDGEKTMTVITLAGENRGAAMNLSNESSKKESPIHIHRGYKLNPDESMENSTKGKDGLNTDEETATKACINSNVQGINNSLLFNGSVSTMNPGVRYVRDNRTPGFDQEGSYDMRKAEVSGIQSEMLAHAPNVRRRCLRGLLMESNDFDIEKPRRHGCYYDRKDKDGNVDIH